MVINDANHRLTDASEETQPVEEVINTGGENRQEFLVVGSHIRELNNDCMEDHGEDEDSVEVALA